MQRQTILLMVMFTAILIIPLTILVVIEVEVKSIVGETVEIKMNTTTT